MLPDAYIAMGLTAENVASMRGISRAEQDEFAVRSQNLAEQAIKNGFYAREITPVETARRHHRGPATTAPAPGVTGNAPGPSVWAASPCSAQTGPA